MEMSPKNLFTKYFKDNKENLKSLDHATFAYHMNHDSHGKAHYFKSGKMHNKPLSSILPTLSPLKQYEYSIDDGVTWITDVTDLLHKYSRYKMREVDGESIFETVLHEDKSVSITRICGIGRPYDPTHNSFYDDTAFKAEECYWCGRSRSDVRWSDESPECSAHPNLDVVKTIYDEEVKTYALLNSGEELIPKILDSKFDGKLSSEALIFLQTTHGFSPDIVSTILDIDVEQYMNKYEELMNIHKSKSGNMFKQ
jgi:hypothetical protein